MLREFYGGYAGINAFENAEHTMDADMSEVGGWRDPFLLWHPRATRVVM